MTHTASTTVDLDQLLASAHDLALAGRWERALGLLDTADCADPDGRARLALAGAEVALLSDWFAGTDLTAARADRAEKEAPGAGWDLGFIRLRHDYRRQLLRAGVFHPGPEGKDPEALAGIRRSAHALRDSAPDEVRRGWASMYLGLVVENLFAERAAAPAHYEDALRAGDAGDGDELLTREALRHLGDHAHDAGDHERAVECWERATALGARAGLVPGVLAQQLLLAVLARDAGDEAGARALAREVARWAEAIGADRLHAQTTGFLHGVDPTAVPEPETDA
ncbi:hypothetical protein ACFUIY_31660 [Streptomyces griseorubiginosus]|uniref:hypothetical protein n=1 Tax=Streptomyces griseorubiginosus TaxID=67304 RepID=UPI00114031B4|nr:hypothetical protein [Streptomyces griseorubiginosus]